MKQSVGKCKQINLESNRIHNFYYLSSTAVHTNIYFWFKYDLDRSIMHPQFVLTGVQTHDLQIITVHFMSLRRLL